MNITKCKDSAGKEYDGYVVVLSEGTKLEIDCRLAKLSGNAPHFIAQEVKAAEEAIRECR